MVASYNLRAAWNQNTDAVTTGYRLYKKIAEDTDFIPIIYNIAGKDTTMKDFTLNVPDGTTEIKFALTALAPTSEPGIFEESEKSATATFNPGQKPGIPQGLRVMAQP